MLKHFAGLLAAAALAIVLFHPAPVRAEILYPWCAVFSGGDGDNGSSCGFVTHAQCLATISGTGGTCYENPAYPGPGQRPIKRRAPKSQD
jgi:hypothetical protein